jgi:putative tryptophan/tyrosine transport system substrate-binding protein
MPHRWSRRQVVQGAGAVGLVLLAGCGRLPWQAAPRMPRIGWLSQGGGQELADAFRQGLEEHGYVEGRTVTVEWRNAGGQLDRLPDLADELIRLPVDVLVADGTLPVRTAMRATGTIPIVMALSASPVEDGFVASLARPGGNVTGLTGIARELIGKRLEALKAADPSVSRVGVLWNPGIIDRAGEFQVVEAAAGTLGLELRSLEARDPAALDAALERALLERVEALYLLDNVVTSRNVARVTEFALNGRLPVMSGNRSTAVAGGLIAYGTNDPDMARRAASFVDRILKGANPADIPVERPMRFDFVINLKTAQALGLTIPPHVLAQATEVIQ